MENSKQPIPASRRLAAAIVLQACKDLVGDDKEAAYQAEAWLLHSPQASLFLGAINRERIDIQPVIDRLKTERPRIGRKSKLWK